MSKSFDEEFEELAQETARKHDENDASRGNEPPMLDGPRALKEREINREFATKLGELRKKYGME